MCKRESGFTLLEIMAVIMILGLAIGMVAVSVGHGGPKKEVDDAVERFMAVANFAAEKSILSGEAMGLLLEPPEWQAEDKRDYEGLGWRYRWKILTETGWQELENLPALSFPPELKFLIEIDEIEWEWENVLIRDEPVAAFYPSGDVSDIAIEITADWDDELAYHLEVNETGDFVWRELEEERQEREENER